MFSAFTSLWGELLTFLVSIFESITSIFVTVGEGGAVTFTFVGVMAGVMAGVALILLVFNLIRSFLAMRG